MTTLLADWIDVDNRGNRLISYFRTPSRTIDADQPPFLQSPLAQEALRIIRQLREAGFVAYLAGGCVRDALLGKKPKDYDVATDATPESVRDVFGKRQTLAFGASFGVIGVLPPKRDGVAGEADPLHRDTLSVEPTEVATFRSDGFYSDGRRPDSVHYGDALHDAQRRDFTINGLFYDPHEACVIDYVGGQKDLEQGVLRTIGDPLQRFGEDKLRMLRAVRFATTLGFEIESQTKAAILGHAQDISVVSGERIGAEMRRILVSPHAAEGIRHLIESRLSTVVLPEVGGKAEQVPDPRSEEPGAAVQALETRFARMIETPHARRFPIALALLVSTTERPIASLKAIARRWRLSNEEVRQANAALKYQSTIQSSDQLPWSQVQPILVDRDAEVIVSVAEAIASADGLPLAGIQHSRERLHWPPEKLDPPPLVTGADLAELGIQPGPAYREILQQTRDQQLNGELSSRAEAIEAIRGSC